MRNASELKQALSSLQSALDSHEKLNVAALTHKLDKASQTYPEDQTIGQMSLILNRINDKNQLFISRAEVKDLYSRLYSNGTKFNHLFASELGIVEEAPKSVPSEFARPEDGKELDLYQSADQSVVAELNNAFGVSAHTYSPKTAQEAEKVVELECSYPEMVPEVKALSGDENCVVVSASYPTSKGKATFFVPVEMVNKQASTPSYFIGKDGTHYLSKSSVAKYIENYFVKSNSYGNVKVASNVEVAKVEDPEMQKFVEKFDSAAGLATLEFGDKVEAGRNLIVSKLAGFGYRHSQVSVLDSDKKGISYGVKCEQIAFKVPVKIEANRIQEPTVLLCQGNLKPLTAEGVKSLIVQKMSDNKVSAVISPMFKLTAADLVEKVQEAVNEENYTKAEDALNVLANSGDAKAYQLALADYSAKLTGKKAEAHSGCSRVVKTSTSMHPVCGHLNLPVSKTFVDKSGNCRPLSRKGEEDGFEGAMFMNSKIFV